MSRTSGQGLVRYIIHDLQTFFSRINFWVRRIVQPETTLFFFMSLLCIVSSWLLFNLYNMIGRYQFQITAWSLFCTVEPFLANYSFNMTRWAFPREQGTKKFHTLKKKQHPILCIKFSLIINKYWKYNKSTIISIYKIAWDCVNCMYNTQALGAIEHRNNHVEVNVLWWCHPRALHCHPSRQNTLHHAGFTLSWE